MSYRNLAGACAVGRLKPPPKAAATFADSSVASHGQARTI
jgi:hypothetical protein